MVIDRITLEDFVETFKKECPEVVNRAVIFELLKYVRNPVKVRLDLVWMELESN